VPRRKRAHIPLIEKLASALADKLPVEERDALRRTEPRIPARKIVAMFTPDHLDLHAFGGADRWWNLDMRRRGADLKAKDAADTTRFHKSERIREREAEFEAVRARLLKPRAQRMICVRGNRCHCDGERRKRCGNYRRAQQFKRTLR
jgi:hypothetical protein